MKKILIILLSFVILAPAICNYILLIQQKRTIKKTVKRQMIAGMDKKDLVFLKFSTAEADSLLEWEHSREFEYKGEMYDVVEKIIRSDSVFYWCWWDFEETELNRKLTAAVSDLFGNSRQTNENQTKLKDYFKSLMITKITAANYLSEKDETFIITAYNNYIPYFTAPPVPPPEC